MAVVRYRYIADTSALARGRERSVRERLEPLILSGELATCSVIELEMLYSARGLDELRETRARRSSLPLVPMEQAHFDRSIEVMEDLARRGQHRHVGAADLLVAVVAELAGLTLVHYDADFDAVAAVTGQPAEWVVPKESVP